MKITNNSDTQERFHYDADGTTPVSDGIVPQTLQLHDALPNGESQQWQDGIRNVVIAAGQTVVIPNLHASVSNDLFKAYASLSWGNGGGSPTSPNSANRLVLDESVEPDGTSGETELNGPIFGLTSLSLPTISPATDAF